jgi:phosphatidylinositol alpha 1,6-mannosyltransferase
VERVEDALREQHLYVHSATREPFGLTIVEAMASGLPVVCIDGGGNAELIENGVNGFVVRPGNVADFADRVEQALGDPARYETLAAGARRTAERYDIGAYAERLLQLYREALVTIPAVDAAGRP